MKQVIKSISNNFIQEAVSSPRMLEDLAAMERYMSESYDGRTFVELLQNADDANSNRMTVFKVGKTLVVANDGRPFDKNDIMAICRSGASSKQRGNNIGYRGVGFKSATTISTEIVIYSASTYFTFSKSVCARELGKKEHEVPTVRIPFLYDEKKLDSYLLDKIEEYKADGYTTFFIFLNGKVEKFLRELNGFNAGWLLFLRNICSVEIDCETLKSRRKVIRKVMNNTDVLIKVVGSKDQWYVINHELVSLAFKYDSSEGVFECSNEDAVFHCFLPTIDKTGFPFKVNADFSTDPSRKHIIQDDSTEQALVVLQKAYAELIQRTISNDEKKLHAILSMLNNHTTLNELVVHFENGILSNLRAMEWIPLNNGQYVSPENAYIMPKWLDKNEKQLLLDISPIISNKVVNNEIFDYIEKSETLLAKIGTKELHNSIIAEMIMDIDKVKMMPHVLIGKIFAYGCRTMIHNKEWMDRLFVPLEQEYIQLVNIPNQGPISEEFCSTIKSILNLKEIDKLISMYPVFCCLNHQNKKTRSIDLKKVELKPSTMAKTAYLAINKWKTSIQNCMAVETLKGNSVKDVKRKCDEYDIISTAKDGTITYISVKEVAVLGDTFKMSEREYAAAQRLGDAYKIYVFSTETSETEYTEINNPVDYLNLEKVVKEWEWLSGTYDSKNMNEIRKPEPTDEKILKGIDKTYFNGTQQEFLRAYLEEPSVLSGNVKKTLIDQINFVFDFHTGEEFFVRKDSGYSVDKGKVAALKQIMK